MSYDFILKLEGTPRLHTYATGLLKGVCRESCHSVQQASSQDLHVSYMDRVLDYTRSHLYYAQINGCMAYDPPLYSIL